MGKPRYPNGMRLVSALCFLLASLPAAAGTVEAPGLALWTGRQAVDQGLVWDLGEVAPFDRAVLSWNADGPATFVLEVDGRQHVMGRWGDAPASQTTSFVAEDTLTLPRPAGNLKVRVLPSPGTEPTLLAVTFWRNGAIEPLSSVSAAARGRVIRGVPHFVQSDDKTCSPTSLAMVLRYYGVPATPDSVAAGVEDHSPNASERFGNWPFNTAYASKASGGRLAGYVRRLSGLGPLEDEIAAGRPTIISYKPNGRSGQGHLIVVIGFTLAGDVVVNDPGWTNGAGRVIPRAAFYQRWLQDAQGIAYFIARAP